MGIIMGLGLLAAIGIPFVQGMYQEAKAPSPPKPGTKQYTEFSFQQFDIHKKYPKAGPERKAAMDALYKKYNMDEASVQKRKEVEAAAKRWF